METGNQMLVQTYDDVFQQVKLQYVDHAIKKSSLRIALTEDIFENCDLMHRNLSLNSSKQQSSQGSVFYVKLLEDINSNVDREFILKIYKSQSMHSFNKELKVLESLREYENILKLKQLKADQKQAFQKQINDDQIQQEQYLQTNLSDKFVGFPKIISVIQSPQKAEFLMEALGPNLRTLLSQSPNQCFSKITIFKIILQLVNRIRTLHETGYVHNDLKLDNILIGNKDPNIIYLIDFGVSCRYIKENGLHIDRQTHPTFSGNFHFASLNNICKTSQSRRDDIQSVFYIMIYLLNENKLPWSGFSSEFRDCDYEFEDYLKERLKIKYTKQVIRLCPSSLTQVFKNVLKLKFDEVPQYDEIILTLEQLIKENVQKSSDPLREACHQFEWSQNPAQPIRVQILRQESMFNSIEFFQNILERDQEEIKVEDSDGIHNNIIESKQIYNKQRAQFGNLDLSSGLSSRNLFKNDSQLLKSNLIKQNSIQKSQFSKGKLSPMAKMVIKKQSNKLIRKQDPQIRLINSQFGHSHSFQAPSSTDNHFSQSILPIDVSPHHQKNDIKGNQQNIKSYLYESSICSQSLSDDIPDYIDENFDYDETDELWGLPCLSTRQKPSQKNDESKQKLAKSNDLLKIQFNNQTN